MPNRLSQIQRLITPRYFLLSLVVAGLSVIALFPHILMLLGLPDYGHWFLDSYAILAASDAVRVGMDPHAANPLDALMRSHVYSDWWLLLGRLGLTREHNFWFGGLCVLGFLAVGLATVKPRSYGESLALVAVMLSPPFLLAMSRANNDLVIFALLGAGLWLVRGRGDERWALVGMGMLLILAAGLKYYPVVGVLAFMLVARPLRTWLVAGFVMGAAAGAVLWFERAAIARAMFRLPDSIFLFGAPVLWRSLGIEGGWVAPLSALLLLAGAWLLMWRGWTKGLASSGAETYADSLAFGLGAVLLTGCFLAGASYAYRWIFGLWLWPWLWSQAGVGDRGARWALALLLVSLWSDGVYCLVINLQLVSFTLTGDMLWIQFAQLPHWLLLAMLAGWLVEAAVATGCELMQGGFRGKAGPPVAQ